MTLGINCMPHCIEIGRTVSPECMLGLVQMYNKTQDDMSIALVALRLDIQANRGCCLHINVSISYNSL